MRIVFVIHQATMEGAGRFLLDEVAYLQGRGVSACVILPGGGSLHTELTRRGIPTGFAHIPWWGCPGRIPMTIDWDAIAAGARQVAALAQDWHADIVYTQTLASPVGVLAAMLTGLPHVWHIHEFSHARENIEIKVSREVLSRFAAESSNLVVFNSKAVAREWDGALPPSQTALVYNWISPDVAAVAPDSPPEVQAVSATLAGRFVAIQLGSVNVHKHQEDAIEALALVVAGGCDAALLVVGPFLDKLYHRDLLELVRKHGLQDRVHFVGYTANPAAWLRLANVSIVCSPLEPFGRGTIESMHHGLPVVGADAAGTAEIVEDGVSGLLFPPNDPKALAARLRELADRPELRDRLSQGARKRAAAFSSAAHQMEPLMQRLEQIVSEPNPAAGVGNVFASILADLAQYDARRMPFAKLLRLAATRIVRRIGPSR